MTSAVSVSTPFFRKTHNLCTASDQLEGVSQRPFPFDINFQIRVAAFFRLRENIVLVVFGMCEGLHLWCSAYLSGLQKSKKVEKLTWTSSPERVGKFIADMLLAFPPVVMG